MLRYSEQGLSARPAFFRTYNEITIVVEDEGKENFYAQIIKKLLSSRIVINHVFGVGGKRQVIKRSLDSGRQNGKHLEFYIIDGDFDELIGSEEMLTSRLYRLRRYDIESFLMEENAICVVAEEEMPTSNVNEYRDIFQFESWISDVMHACIRLVACLAVVQKLEITETGIGAAIERYVDANGHMPNEGKIEKSIMSVKASLSEIGEDQFEELLQETATAIGCSDSELLRWVSGKDILIPLLNRLLRGKTGRGLKKESLCFRLAKHCEFTTLSELAEKIAAASER